MQIIHLTTLHPRTDARIFVKQVQTLNKAIPYEVALVVADGIGNELSEEKPYIYDLGSLRIWRFCRALVGPARAIRFIFKKKPVLIHFHDPELIPLGLLLKMLGHKVLYDVHEDVPLQVLNKYWIPEVLRRPVALSMSTLEWLAARFFDAIVPATPKIAKRFPSYKTVVVQNFPIKSELLLSASTPYARRPLKFAYLGRIAKNRGAREMVHALGSLRHLPNVRLEMAGRFDPEALKDELCILPSWSAVNYHGLMTRPEVAGLLGNVRAGLVVLYPTQNYVDAYPVKMFEYMAAGLPVIASDFPLWRQIVGGAGCGLLVDPMNPKAIADAMIWILEYPAEAEAMGQRGKKIVDEIYNWDTEAAKLINLYRKLIPS